MIEVTGLERRAFFTPSTLADYLSCSRRSVYAMLDSGKLRSYKVPGAGRRIRPEDVDEFLADHETETSNERSAR